MSDCEVEVFAGWMRMETAREERLLQGDIRIQKILDMNSATKAAVRQTVGDKAFERAEVEYICDALPQWTQNYEEAEAYIDSIKQGNEWQSLAIDILRFERTRANFMEMCNGG